MAGPLVSISSDSNPDQQFTFTHLIKSGEIFLQDKAIADFLSKWGLSQSMFKLTFSFDQAFREYQAEKVVRDLFSDKSNFEHFKAPYGRSIDLDVDKLVIEPLSCAVTSMEFFDRLYLDPSSEGPGLVRKSGQICGCFEDMYHEMCVGDELRKMFVSDESDHMGIYSESEMNEFIYHLLKLVCLGGALNQYEDTVQPYFDVVLFLYRNLINVVKDGSDNIRTSSVVYRVTGYKGDKLVFPSVHYHPQNICYAIVDPYQKHVTTFYHIWK